MKKFFYRVQKCDSLLTISEKLSVPVGSIITLNALTGSPAEGDILYIERDERLKTHIVGINDTLESLARYYCTTPEKILSDNAVDYLFYGLKIYL